MSSSSSKSEEVDFQEVSVVAAVPSRSNPAPAEELGSATGSQKITHKGFTRQSTYTSMNSTDGDGKVVPGSPSGSAQLARNSGYGSGSPQSKSAQAAGKLSDDEQSPLLYLHEHNVPYLLQRLVRELVEKKPNNPLNSIVTWLVSRCQLREMLEEGVIPYNLSDEEAAKCLRAPPDDALWGRFMTDEALWDDIAELGFDRSRAEEMQWVFGEYADVESGTVTLSDIRRILSALNQSPSHKKLAEAFTRLDQDHSSRLDFLEFLSLTQMIDPDAIPKTVAELGIDGEQFAEIKIAFEEADISNLHFIDEKQIRFAVESLNIRVPQKVLREKFKAADEDSSGKIDLNEFLKMVASLDKDAENKLCENLSMTMAELENLRAAFEEASSEVGLVSFDDVKRVLAQMDQSPSMKQLRKGFNSFDKDKSGNLDFHEFVQLMKKIDPQQLKNVAQGLNLSDDELEEYRSAFNAYDDGTNVIHRPDFEDLLSILGHFPEEHVLLNVLFVLDEEQTGEYDFVEFLRGIVLLVKSEGTRRMSSQEVAYLRTIFERNDKHGTGMVDGMDLQYMIQDVRKKTKFHRGARLKSVSMIKILK